MSGVQIYCDGACSGNPGPGGWGAILIYGQHQRELSGGETETTNNRMELTAAIKSLDALKRGVSVAVYTDSTYVRDGITKWVFNWQKNGWRTADNKPVKNADLWQLLVQAVSRHQVEWHWVKGHSGDPMNDRADQLARNAITRLLSGDDSEQVVTV